jgi:hypothetical protein
MLRFLANKNFRGKTEKFTPSKENQLQNILSPLQEKFTI